MLAKLKSFSIEGVGGYPVDIEIDINNGIPSYETVGLAGTAVKEAKERVRAAIKNGGFLRRFFSVSITRCPRLEFCRRHCLCLNFLCLFQPQAFPATRPLSQE